MKQNWFRILHSNIKKWLFILASLIFGNGGVTKPLKYDIERFPILRKILREHYLYFYKLVGVTRDLFVDFLWL